jgi:hypothetical protein
MICVRCLADTASKIADAPDGSRAWEMYYCKRCNYSWRSTEGEQILNIEKRNPVWQLDKDFEKLDPSNPIPPLNK